MCMSHVHKTCAQAMCMGHVHGPYAWAMCRSHAHEPMGICSRQYAKQHVAKTAYQGGHHASKAPSC